MASAGMGGLDPKKEESWQEDMILSEEFIRTNERNEQELLKNLGDLSKYISEYPDDEEEKGRFATVAAALIRDSLIKHKNSDVRLFVALCIASIFRVYAPEIPYVDVHLKKILKLFIEQLAGLENPKHSAAVHLIVLLERITSVKTIVVFLDYTELVTKFIKLLFRVVNNEHPQMVMIHIMDIMVSCIEESDQLPTEILDALLMNMVEQRRNMDEMPPSQQKLEWMERLNSSMEGGENQKAKFVTQQVVMRTCDRLEPAVTKLLIDCISGMSRDSELSYYYHELIYELFLISPSMVYGVLPELVGELKCDQIELRMKVVDIMGRIFATPDVEVVGKCKKVFELFLTRFRDVEKKIRILMIEFAKHFQMNVEDGGNGMELVNEGLCEKLRDADEDVRLLALLAVVEVSISRGALNLDGRVLGEVVVRINDRKASVRNAAVIGVSKMYMYAESQMDGLRKQMKKSDMGSKVVMDTQYALSRWKKRWLEVYENIPGKMMVSYAIGNIEDQVYVEKVLFEELLNPKRMMNESEEEEPKWKSKRMARRMVDMTMEGEKALKSFMKYVSDKVVFRREMREWLTFKSESMMMKLKRRLPKWTQGNGGGGGQDQLLKMLKMCDDQVNHWLMVMVMKESSYEEEQKAKEKLWKYLNVKGGGGGKKKWKNQGWMECMEMIVRRISFPFVTPEVVNYMVKWLCHLKSVGDEGEKKQVVIMEILVQMSEGIPGYFASSVEEMLECLECKEVEVVNAVLKILTEMVSSSDRYDHLIKESFLKLALNGKPREAKYASLGLLKVLLRAKNEGKRVEVVRKLLNVASGTRLRGRRVGLETVSALVSLTEFVKVPGMMEEKEAHDLCIYVLEEVWKWKEEEGGRRGGGVIEDQVSERTLIKAEGMVYVVAYIKSMVLNEMNEGKWKEKRELEEKSGKLVERVMEELFEYLEELECMEVNEQYMQATAVSSVMELAENRLVSESWMGLERFQKLAYILRRESDHQLIKTSMRTSMFKGLINLGRLPLKYMSLYALFPSSQEKSGEVREEFEKCVMIRRVFLRKRMNGGVFMPLIDKRRMEGEESKWKEGDGRLSKWMSSILPEYALPWLIHLLAHEKSFLKEQLTSLRKTMESLSFFFDVIMQGTDNFEFLLHMLLEMKQAEDAQSPDLYHVQMVTEMAVMILNKRPMVKLSKEQWLYSGTIYLPKELCRVSMEEDGVTPKLLPLEATYLPEGLEMEDLVLWNSAGGVNGHVRKRKREDESGEDGIHIAGEESPSDVLIGKANEVDERLVLPRKRDSKMKVVRGRKGVATTVLRAKGRWKVEGTKIESSRKKLIDSEEWSGEERRD